MASTPHPLLPAGWSVPERFKERLGSIAGKQRAMEADGHLLLILHELPDPESHERVARLFWRAADGSWKSTNGGTGSRALAEHLRLFAERIDRLEDQEEEARRAADYFELLQQIVPLQRTTRNLHATLQQAREAVPKDRELLQFRDQAGELERALELLHADVENGLSYTVAHQAEEQARRANEMATAAHRLNVLAAIFFPVGTVAAIFGMNLVHGYEHWQAPWTFWCVSAVSLVLGFFLAMIIVRRPAPPPPPPPVSGNPPPTARGRGPTGKKKR
jgi:hypothetical protein